MTLNEFIQKALLVPYKDRGRDYDGWDCYGLAYIAYRDVYGIELPEYLNYSYPNEYQVLKKLIESAKPLWDVVTKPAAGDLALFNISGSPCHVALVVDKRSALHAEKKLGTFVEPLKGTVWGKRLEGIYRFKNDS